VKLKLIKNYLHSVTRDENMVLQTYALGLLHSLLHGLNYVLIITPISGADNGRNTYILSFIINKVSS
jgi:hypothetical protein